MSHPGCYFDSSVIVKLYVQEAGSADAAAYFNASELIASHEIAFVEVRAALSGACRGGRLDEAAHTRSVGHFSQDWMDCVSEVSTDRNLLMRAAELAEGLALRGYDAVHLASAERMRTALPEIHFASFDRTLNRAARLLGFPIPGFVPQPQP